MTALQPPVGVTAAEPPAVRTRLRVQGIVQGVGFRPHVYRLAGRLGLSGFVLNDAAGVLIEVEGAPAAVREFTEQVAVQAPPLAVLERVHAEPVAPTGEPGFRIAASIGATAPDAPVAPDTAPCAACLAELSDPDDRRHRYPFINCTDCGPRFSIIRSVPYDRPGTTMAGFHMCPACQAEYDDPADRRFHAQPNACPDCGPALALVTPGGAPVADPEAALAAAEAALRTGAILAVKGIGGFHLACRAADERAVAALRARKHREDRPFALMVADERAARELVELSDAEAVLLGRPQRPIVIARRGPEARVAAGVAPGVAPGSPDLGVMLPYSPLHQLLLGDLGEPLVMTSGNVSDEPIAYRDDEALVRLAGIADLFLLHDRPIETRTDDSVLRAVSRREAPLFIRRSRGYAPAPLRLPVAAERPVLACGAELKSTFCLVRGHRAWVSHHIGDLENYETLRSFSDGVEHFRRLFDVDPEIVAFDLHPDYLSTRYALDRPELVPVAVQHHHAHLAAGLAEHGERGPALGAIFDGTGLGTDRSIWGGELLAGDLEGFERAGHLHPVRLPGGAQAIREPWRMACAWLVEADRAAAPPAALAGSIDRRWWERVAELCRTGLASPPTTSMGRLFDAVSALCAIRLSVSYEGQAAAELEAICDPAETGAYPLALVDAADGLVLDARETVTAVARERELGVPVGRIAARFHNAVAAATTAACIQLAGTRGLDTVVLSGGTFQNRLLLERTAAGLARAGLRVLVPERLPPNDGGIAFGQAAVAAARIART